MRSIHRIGFAVVLCATFAFAGATQAFAFFEDPRVNGGARVDADDIGTLYVPSGVRGAFTSQYDSDDVARVRLFKGETVYVALKREMSTGLNVFLYGPGTTTVKNNDEGIIAEGEPSSDDPDRLRFTYVVPATGYYYMDVWHPDIGTVGSYTLYYFTEWGDDNDLPPGAALPAAGEVPGLLDATWDVDDVFRVPLKSGDNFTAKITDCDDWPEIDFDLLLYGPGAPNVDGGEESNAFIRAKSQTDKTIGERISYVAPSAGTYSLDVYADSGGGDYNLEYSTLTRPAGTTKAASCYLSPKVSQGTRPVTLMVEKKVGSRWKPYKSFPAKAVNAGSRSKCVATLNLSARYTWRVRAKTSSHGLGTRYSGWSYTD